MKDVELGSRARVARRAPVWFFAFALLGIGAGALLLLRVPARPRSQPIQPQSVATDQSAELDRLKQAVAMLEHKSAALAAVVSAPHQDPNQRAAGDDLAKASPEPADTRSAAEMQRDVITELEARFESEKDGSRDSLLAAQTMQAELRAAPLGEARIKNVACSASLCRATLEQDVSAKPLDMGALIQSTPTVRQQSMFDYDQEGSVKRVTIYSAREGYQLSSSEPRSTGPTNR